jgi:AraC family transcriptional regulator
VTGVTASLASSCPHEATEAVRARAVASAINVMRDRLGEHQELKDAACAAFMSPFHFHRVFRSITSATPGQFRTAMRMAEAKRLLIECDMSATDISVAVGYGSFGTFTSQFTKLVGMPPGRFRRAAAAVADIPVAALLGRLEAEQANRERHTAGWLSARPDRTAGVAIVGLFPATIAQELPVACGIAEPPGRVTLPVERIRGSFVALAVSVRAQATVREVLTESPAAGIYVGSAPEPVELTDTSTADDFFIALRDPQVTDPAVLTAFPLLALSGVTRPAQAS